MIFLVPVAATANSYRSYVWRKASVEIMLMDHTTLKLRLQEYRMVATSMAMPYNPTWQIQVLYKL